MKSVLNREISKVKTASAKTATVKTSMVMLAALLGSLAASSAKAYAADPKITLTRAMVTNEIAHGDAGFLVDEQAVADNPAAGAGGSPSTSWTNSIGYDTDNWYYPARAIIDLGATYNISNVSMYDMNGIGDVVVSKGTPFNWTPVYTQSLSNYNAWDVQSTSFQTRYLQVKVMSNSAVLGEIVLNGTLVSAAQPTPTPAPSTRVRPTMETFIGANAFSDDPVDKLTAVGFIREYHNWDWNPEPGALFPNNRNYWNSTPSGFAFDNFYAAAKSAGLQVSPAIQGSAAIALPPGADLGNKPVAAGANAELPASYNQHADFMFQYAARYGNTTVAQSLLKVNPLEVPLTNARVLNWYENWNEENAWWKGRAGYFSPYEMAAMSSADYDGDQGRMGSIFGVKNADPTAKMAIGGLANSDIEYWKAMKLWCDYYRGGSFPGDAINVHWYSSNGAAQGGNATQGISPEDDNVKGHFEELVRWRDANLPNAEVWVSEFGYDTSQASPIHAPPIGSSSVEEVQGRWLVRSYLALAAAGVDRAQMYMFRDTSPRDTGGLFETCGLVTQKGEWTPKISWYYVSTLNKRLKGMRFDSVVNSGNSNVYVYKFKTPSGSKTAYAVWCPTSNSTTVSNFQLAVGSAVSGVSRIDLTSGQANGVATPLAPSNGNASLDVSERPTLIITDNVVANATEVTITSPADGARFTASGSFSIDAAVSYNANPISQVDFYSNNTLVGTDTSAPWSVPVGNLAAGVYDLKAVAKESSGASYTSAAVRVVVPSGTGLTGKYFNGSNFEALAKTQIDPTINFDWGFGSYAGPDTIADHNAFSVRWTGQIQALESGTYNIGSTFDDAIRITINDGTADKKIVDRWNSPASTYYVVSGLVNLVGGQKYNISIDYAQRSVSGNGGLAAATLKWIRPGQTSFEVVPQSQLYPVAGSTPPTVGTGLKGQYYINDNFYGGLVFTNLFKTRTDATVNFDWAYGAPDAGMSADNFSVRWTGQVQAVEAGTYTFTTSTDDGVRLWVNGQQLVNKWQGQGTTSWSGTIDLTAGQKYDIKMEYFENGGAAVAKLQWKRPGQTTAVAIPQTQLYPAL